MIQLIEADLQLLMHIFLGIRDNQQVENDNRFSKSNYGSCRNYSIESVLLEKCLIYDNNMLSGKQTIQNLIDL